MIQNPTGTATYAMLIELAANLPLIYRLIQSQDNEIQILENDTLRDLVSIFEERW